MSLIKNNFTLFFFVVFIILFKNNLAQQEIKPVEIPGTYYLKIYSSIVDQEYVLYINLPRNFYDTTKTFPVIYLLDAQWDFPLANAIYGEQYYDGFVPEVIIVGITWGGINPNPDSLRRRDFTPSKEKENPIGGGAQKFLSFIKGELIPFVDSKFRIKPDDKTLMGSSLGGLFTLYTLFNETELFNKYVLTSPALDWDNDIVYSFEKKYSEENLNLPVELYMAIGGYEDVESFQEFVTLLKKRNYKKFKLRTRILDGIGHSGSKAEGYARGLQFIFEKAPFFVSPDILDKYVASYQFDSTHTMKIYRDNDHLVAKRPKKNDRILYPESKKYFYAKGEYLLFSFEEDEFGNITGVQVEDYNGKKFYRKLSKERVN